MRAFVTAIAMWWIYFHKGAGAGSELISRSVESRRLARSAYTYLHMPIIAGIILSAVADELVLKHPTGVCDLKTALSALAGPLLFLAGSILFKHNIRGFLQLSHCAGIVALTVFALFADKLSPLMLSVAGHGASDRRRGVGVSLAAVQDQGGGQLSGMRNQTAVVERDAEDVGLVDVEAAAPSRS